MKTFNTFKACVG